VIGLFLLLVFALFAVLMFARLLPALLAVPAMAVSVAVLVGLPFDRLLQDVVSGGALRLAPAYVAVCAGAMLSRVMMDTGIAAGIIKLAAELGGDKPMVVAAGLMVATAVLFTSLTGLGAVIMVGTLVLPIMMSLGVPRKLAAVLFLMAFATGFVFNIALWRLYRELLQLAPASALPPAIPRFATSLLIITALIVLGYTVLAARRSGEISLWSAAEPGELVDRLDDKRVPLVSLATPLVPLVLYVALGWSELPAFLAGSLFGTLVAAPRRLGRVLSAAAVRGVEDGAPAAILLVGIGMLLNALTLPAVQEALGPLMREVPIGTPLGYVAFFGLLSPLALYRGPLNPFGVGIGIYSLLFATGTVPPLALLAAIMSVVQVQNVCDPTNTHNVWVAQFTGVHVDAITRAALPTMMLVCLGGLISGAWWFLR
jgi:hypothetical protein